MIVLVLEIFMKFSLKLPFFPHLLELFAVNEAIAVSVENFECILDLLGLINSICCLEDQFQELFEIDCSIAVHVKFNHLKSCSRKNYSNVCNDFIVPGLEFPVPWDFARWI